MKINEQIATLRKQKGITQGELAQALGVTNQSVSKWESGQCCPDIQLLPELAKYFDISIDELMCEKAPETDHERNIPSESGSNINDPLLDRAIEFLGKHRLISTSVLQRKLGIGYSSARDLIEELQSRGYITEVRTGFYKLVESQRDLLETVVKTAVSQGREDMLNIALAMHAAWFLREQKAESSVNSGVKTVVDGLWGYSAFSEPDMTTVMRGQSVFYSKNKSLDLNSDRLGKLSVLFKVLSDRKNLTVLAALYELTVHDEGAHAAIEEISEKSKLTPQTVRECLEGGLIPYIREDGEKYRIKGEEMAIIPIISILCY